MPGPGTDLDFAEIPSEGEITLFLNPSHYSDAAFDLKAYGISVAFSILGDSEKQEIAVKCTTPEMRKRLARIAPKEFPLEG